MTEQDIKFLEDNRNVYSRFKAVDYLKGFDFQTAARIMRENFRPGYVLDENNPGAGLNLVKDLYTLYERSQQQESEEKVVLTMPAS